MLIQAIERLWSEVERLNRPVVGFRAPGISPTAVERVIGDPVPGDVVTWFGWSNGIEHHPDQIQDDAFLVPGYEPLSLVEAKEIRDSFQISDPVLRERYVPILATGGGDFYAVVQGDSMSSSRVAHAMIGGEVKFVYRSLEHMADSFCRFYREGIFFVSDEGTLEADDHRWVEAESVNGSGL
jgi:hypothetical protein